jgi:hypothetical protein
MLLPYVAPLIDCMILDGCIAELSWMVALPRKSEFSYHCNRVPCDRLRWEVLMTRLTLIAIMAAVVAYQATTNSASASPITYDLVGVTAAFADNTETDYFSGTFTYDASTAVLSAVSITVSGPVDAGFFTTAGNRALPFNNQIQFSDSSYTWIMSFWNTSFSLPVVPLDVSPDQLSAVYNSDNILTNGVTGAAVATPLPAALPLLATGIGAMGLLGWRRKRKNAATIAAA